MKKLASIAVTGLLLTRLGLGCASSSGKSSIVYDDWFNQKPEIFGHSILLSDLEKETSSFRGKYILVGKESNLAFRNMIPSCDCPEFFGIAVYETKEQAEKAIPLLNNGGRTTYSVIEINPKTVKNHVSIWRQ